MSKFFFMIALMSGIVFFITLLYAINFVMDYPLWFKVFASSIVVAGGSIVLAELSD